MQKTQAMPFLLTLGCALYTSAAAQARPCESYEINALVSPATEHDNVAYVECSATLHPSDVVTRQLIFSGDSADGVTLNCNGATLDGGAGTVNAGRDMIRVVSEVAGYPDGQGGVLHYQGHPVPAKSPDFYYDARVPEFVDIMNCNVIGSIRIAGLGDNGQRGYQWYSSRDTTWPGHVERARAAAPFAIRFDNMVIEGTGRIPLYAGPGVTNMLLFNSEIRGTGVVAIYLDAESGHNLIVGNHIHVGGGSSQIAIDSSSDNLIQYNFFSALHIGGIYLYRNCGEGGVVRYTRPSYNTIVENEFYYSSYQGNDPAVYLGARRGAQSYCDDDANSGVPNSSASYNGDYAQNNSVVWNRFHVRSPSDMIVTSTYGRNSPNTIANNSTIP